VDALNQKIFEFGTTIYRDVKKNSSKILNPNFMADKAMAMSSKYPHLKTGLFQFVDVLPALKTPEKVAEHFYSYLGQNTSSLPPLLRGALRASEVLVPNSAMSAIAKLFVGQMGNHFIAGQSSQIALPKLKGILKDGQVFTVDLLGEYSMSEEEAEEYIHRYMECLDTLSKQSELKNSITPKFATHPTAITPINVSVKLSALYSQCSPVNFDKSVSIMSERLAIIARRAKQVGAQMYVDAEDSLTNPMIYAAFKKVFGSAEFKDFAYAGIIVQAYNKDSEALLNDLIQFAKDRGCPIAVRLVKGAYWDQELSLCQLRDWSFPLYSKKENSDANYEKLSRLLLDNHKHVFPAFASHNIRSLCHAICYAESKGLTANHFELQMLYGMSNAIAPAFTKAGYLVRLYVPLGQILPGIGYLVRRLLENTANDSFVNHLFLQENSLDSLLRPPQFQAET
jgi:proline dehydrogenase